MSLPEDLKARQISDGAENGAKLKGWSNVEVQSTAMDMFQLRDQVDTLAITYYWYVCFHQELVLVTSKVKMWEAKEASYMVAGDSLSIGSSSC